MSSEYYVTVGLEIHAELKTKTKMFCSCRNDPDEIRPNVNVCPVCVAHPGALPVPNKEAVKQVVRVGLAVGGNVADFTEFDRKNYFYPDIPKGYQISQYKYPIVSGGKLAGFDITRIHLEEDTGNSKHDRGDFSLLDFNRAGIPLMELVTEPQTFGPLSQDDPNNKTSKTLSSAEVAGMASAFFAREYQLLLWYLGASEANMEKGEMRVEANISVTTNPKALEGDIEAFGTKVEVKNLNSIRSAERAIKYEAARMVSLLEKAAQTGDNSGIFQETRGWDEVNQATFSQRSKEEAKDYRYFPDPDLPKMKLHSIFDLENLKANLSELPENKRARYKEKFGLKDEDIEIYIHDPVLASQFETIASALQTQEKVKVASNYITSDFIGIKKTKPEAQLPDAERFSELVNMIVQGVISSRGAKDILSKMVGTAVSSISGLAEPDLRYPKEIAEAEGLLQKNDSDALKALAEKVIALNPKIVETYKSGKENALMSLVGIIMKETKGAANPQLVQTALRDLLK